VGTVNGFVTTSRPARALAEKRGVIAIANDDDAGSCLSLEMTFEAEISVALCQHFLVRGAVWIMACDASFTDCFMLENKRTPLGDVALHACVAFRGH